MTRKRIHKNKIQEIDNKKKTTRNRQQEKGDSKKMQEKDTRKRQEKKDKKRRRMQLNSFVFIHHFKVQQFFAKVLYINPDSIVYSD